MTGKGNRVRVKTKLGWIDRPLVWYFGRQRHNARMRAVAEARRLDLARLARQGFGPREISLRLRRQNEFASMRSIQRDIAILRVRALAQRHRCPICGTELSSVRWAALAVEHRERSERVRAARRGNDFSTKQKQGADGATVALP